MTSHPPDRLQQLLRDALDRPPGAERTAFLDHACDDPELRSRVRTLLESEADAEEFFASLADDLGLGRDAGRTAGDLAGRTVGSYRLLEPLGRGGMGVVYLAERADGEFDHRVAVKLLAMGVSSPEARARFLAERQILAGFEHPAIARLLDGGVTDDGTPYFVMERVEGEPIDAWCDGRRLPIDERVRLMIRVCEAVQAAHRELIVHRDLKPANVLVTREGQPKLLDFGVAKILSGADGDLTRSRVAPLTPAWAAPEQLSGEPITTATDTYALGALLYRLLVGIPPYELRDTSPMSLLAQLSTEPPPPSRRFRSLDPDARITRAAARGVAPAALVRSLEGDLDAIVGRALAPDPRRRYGSADGLAEDLRAYLESRPVAARPPSTAYRLSRFVRRHRVASAAAAVILAVGVAGLTATLWQARQATAEAARAESALDYVTGLLTALVPESDEPIVDRRLVLARAARDADEALAGEPLALADVQDTIATLASRIGDYRLALALREQVLAARRDHLGEVHPDTAEALGAWARTRDQMGDPNRGEVAAAYEGAIERLARYPKEASRQAALRAAYASYLGEQDDMPGALRQLESARELLTSANATSNRQWLEIAEHTGAVLARMDRLDDAERVLRPAVDEARRVLSEHDQLLAELLAGLGNVLARTHDYDGAIDALDEAVRIGEALYPEGNESTLDTLSNLATALMGAGRHAQAIEVREAHLDAAKKIFGETHHQVALGLSELGTLHFRRGDFARAAELQIESADVFERLYGPDHAAVAIVRANLADALFELGHYRQAQAEWQAVQEPLCATFGETSSRCARLHNSLGRVELELGRVDVAETHFRSALAGHRQTLGDDHPDVAGTRAWLAESLRRQGRLDEATVEMNIAASLIPDDRPERHYHFMVVTRLRARLICQVASRTECEASVRTADAALATTYPSGHPHRQELVSLLAGS